MSPATPTHEIIDPSDGSIVGTAVILDDGKIAITVNGHFSGIYRSFETWNIGMSYQLRPIYSLLSNEELDSLLDYDVNKKYAADPYDDFFTLDGIDILDDLN